MNKNIRISVRISQEEYNFLMDLFDNSTISEAIRFAIEMLKILVDRGFYCKLIDCPNVKIKDDGNDWKKET